MEGDKRVADIQHNLDSPLTTPRTSHVAASWITRVTCRNSSFSILFWTDGPHFLSDETEQMLINMNGARLHLRRVGQLVHHFAGYLQAVILR